MIHNTKLFKIFFNYHNLLKKLSFVIILPLLLIAVSSCGNSPGTTKKGAKPLVIGDLSLSQDFVKFADVSIEETAMQPITVTNIGGAPVLPYFSTDNEDTFPLAGTCVQNILPAGASCVLEVYFKPKSAEKYKANLTVDAEGKVKDVALDGSGTVGLNLKTVTLTYGIGTTADEPSKYEALPTKSPNIGFDRADLGADSAQVLYMKVLNKSKKPIQMVESVSGSSYQILSSTCTATLTNGDDCITKIIFRPNLEGANKGSYRIQSGKLSNIVALTGDGKVPAYSPAGALLLNKTRIDFFDTLVGAVSNPLTLSVINEGASAAELKIDYSTLTAVFKASPNAKCISPLAAGERCDIDFTFQPFEYRNGDIQTGTVKVNGAVVTLAGKAVNVPLFDGDTSITNLKIDKNSYDFQRVITLTKSPAARFTLTATGSSVTVAIANIGSEFTLDQSLSSSACTVTVDNKTTITAGKPCELLYVFAPKFAGITNGTVVLEATNSGGGADETPSFTISLTGEGYSKTSVPDFGTADQGVSSVKSISYINSSIDPIKIGQIDIESKIVSSTGSESPAPAGTFALVSNTCADRVVKYGGICRLDIRFTPQGVREAYIGKVTIKSTSGATLDQLMVLGATGKSMFVPIKAWSSDVLTSSNGEAMTSFNNVVYATGGTRDMNNKPDAKNVELYTYDVAINSWRMVKPDKWEESPFQRYGAAVSLHFLSPTLDIFDGKLYVMSGMLWDPTKSEGWVKKHLVSSYDPTNIRKNDNGEWKSILSQDTLISQTPPIDHIDRRFATSTRAGNELYLFGGEGTRLWVENGKLRAERRWDYNNSFTAYDLAIANNKQMEFADTQYQNIGLASAVTVDGFIYVYGGSTGKYNGINDDARDTLNLHRPACTPDNDKAIKFSTNQSSDARFASGSDTPPISHSTAVVGIDTVSGVEGRIYLVGGRLSDGLYQFVPVKDNPNDPCSKVTGRWNKVAGTGTDFTFLPSARLVNINNSLWIHNGEFMVKFIP